MTPGPRIAILGAGLSGLSLADALLDRDPSMQLELIDRRRRWDSDRTWCTWLTGPLRFAELARHHWTRWRVVSHEHATVHCSQAHPYIHLDAGDLYAQVLSRIERAPHAHLHPGVRVRGVRDRAGGVLIETDRGSVEADLAVDALGTTTPLIRSPPRAVDLRQRFLGWTVQAAPGVFDPDTVTLMDLRGRSHGALDFFYVLPFSDRRALVEQTSIGTGGANPTQRRRMLAAELDRLAGAGRWRTLAEEHGVLPMSDARYPTSRGPRVYAVGGGAGAHRPSSAYAFTRIQRHVEAVADALLAGAPAPRLGNRHRYALDRVFLEAIAGAADGGERLLSDLARRVDGATFARFMTDASSPRDEARVAAALPALPLSAVRALAARRREPRRSA